MGKKRVNKYPKAFRKMALERLKSCRNVTELSVEFGGSSDATVQVAGPDGSGGGWRGPTRKQPGTGTSQGDPGTEAGAGIESAGSGFFQRCLEKSRGSTPEQQRLWRDGIYDQIREVMPMQGSLSIERMCQLAEVSRAGFYRSLQEQRPVEEEMEVRSAIQQVALDHRHRYGSRRITKEGASANNCC